MKNFPCFCQEQTRIGYAACSWSGLRYLFMFSPMLGVVEYSLYQAAGWKASQPCFESVVNTFAVLDGHQDEVGHDPGNVERQLAISLLVFTVLMHEISWFLDLLCCLIPLQFIDRNEFAGGFSSRTGFPHAVGIFLCLISNSNSNEYSQRHYLFIEWHQPLVSIRGSPLEER